MEIDRVRRNVSRMLAQGAGEGEIESYLGSEGVTAMDLRHGGKVDSSRGGPAALRALVGKETDTGRRRDILSKFYPYVAQDEDNFVVGDDSGKFLFNPPGLDMGDVAGSAREITQGIAGVGAGALSAAASPFVAAPVASAVSAGTGQAFDETADNIANLYLATQGKEPIPKKDFWSQMREAGVETGAGTAGDLLFRGAGKVAGKVLNPVSPRLQSIYARLGVQPPSIGSVSEGGFYPWMENAVSRVGLGDDLLQASRQGGQAVRGGLERGAQQIKPNISASGEELGSRVLDKIKSENAALGEWYEQTLERAVGDLSQTPAGLSNTMKWIDDTARELSLSGRGETSDAFRSAMQSTIQNQMKDARGKLIQTGILDAKGNAVTRRLPPELNAQSLKNLRSVMREKIESMPELTAGDIGKGLASRLRSALNDDLVAAIPPENLSAYRAAQRAYGQRRGLMDVLEQDFGGGKTPQAVGDALAKADVDPQKLRNLLSMPNQGEDALDDIAAFQLANMAKSGPGAVEGISPDIAATNWRKMADKRPEVAELLFGGTPPQDAADALALAQSMKQQGLYRNTSGTAQAADALSTLKAGTGLGIGMAGSFLGGTPITDPAAAAYLAGGLMGPWAFGKFSTSPAVINAMGNPTYRRIMDAAISGGNPATANIGRFLGIAGQREGM